MVDDPQLQDRLRVARLEAQFEKHLRQAFGDRHTVFSSDLRSRLRELWTLALHTEKPGISVDETRTALQRAYKTRSNPLGRKTPPVSSPTPTLYPATVGRWSPEHPAAEERDCTRPACPSCGGRGMGDYPFPCDTCGGSGNG